MIAFIALYKPHLSKEGWVAIGCLGLFAVFFLAYNLYLIARYRRKVRYADIFKELNAGFAHLHKLFREDVERTVDVASTIQVAVDSISNAFSKIYDHHISVCIKLIEFKNDRALVYTMTRDRLSLADRKTGKSDVGEHWIDGNSGFNFLYSNFENDNTETSFYHQTRLPVRRDYRNTRLDKNWPPKKLFWPLDDYIRNRNWPLKYKSVLMVPIVPLLADDQNQKALSGFLCLDSHRCICFNNIFDVDILKGLADGLYNSIQKLNEVN